MFSIAHSAAVYGIQQNLQRFEIAADRVSDPDSVADLGEVMEMKRAEQGIGVNVAVIKTANQMAGQLLDILA